MSIRGKDIEGFGEKEGDKEGIDEEEDESLEDVPDFDANMSLLPPEYLTA